MTKQEPWNDASAYKPPLRYKVLTPLYDFTIAYLTREKTWRNAFINEISPSPTDRIIDIGCGTGSLAVAILKREPRTDYLGIDPDADALSRARAKIIGAGLKARMELGFFSANGLPEDSTPNKVISSLVLHQVPLGGKKQIITDMFRVLASGGKVHIADYGYQKPGLMRLLFRITVQALDGVADTQPNAEGIIPKLLEQTGFTDVCEVSRIPTLTGTISIYSGEKP